MKGSTFTNKKGLKNSKDKAYKAPIKTNNGGKQDGLEELEEMDYRVRKGIEKDKNFVKIWRIMPERVRNGVRWDNEFKRLHNFVPKTSEAVTYKIKNLMLPTISVHMCEEELKNIRMERDIVVKNGENNFFNEDYIVSGFIMTLAMLNYLKFRAYFTFDEDLMDELWEEFDADNVKLTMDDIKLPYNCMYVKYGEGLFYEGNEKRYIDGFYVWEEPIDNKRKDIIILPMSNAGLERYDYKQAYRSFFRISLTDKELSVKELMDNDYYDFVMRERSCINSDAYRWLSNEKKQIANYNMTKKIQTYKEFIDDTKDVFYLAIAMLRYISAVNADITIEIEKDIDDRKGKKNKELRNLKNLKNLKDIKEAELKKCKVGESIGIRIRELKSRHGKNTKNIHINNGEVTYHVKPHIRKAHYHTYLYGKGKKERKIIWVAPIYVGYEGKEHKSPNEVTITKVRE